MQDQDWLDRRLAVQEYLPDDGFTAKVVGRLPARRSRFPEVRGAILTVFALAAFSLLLLHLGALFMSYQHLAALQVPEMRVRVPQFNLMRAFGDVLQPMFLLRAGGVMVALSLASIPMLRRWA